jgi:hypothetical protein
MRIPIKPFTRAEDERVLAALRLWDQGKTGAQIAARLGSHDSVWRRTFQRIQRDSDACEAQP